METFLPFVTTVALIWKLVDFIKMLWPRIPAPAVQLIVWVLGSLVLLLLQASDFGADIQFGARTLDQLNVFSVIIIGAGIGSTSSAVVDFKKARDNTDSATMPSADNPAGLPVTRAA